MSDKSREFWIDGVSIITTEEWYIKEYEQVHEKPMIHVIEYNAFEELECKIIDLQKLRKFARHNYSCDIFSMKAECDCGFSKLLYELGMK
jgi:hypothetical protein